jgi:hypothetical protein
VELSNAVGAFLDVNKRFLDTGIMLIAWIPVGIDLSGGLVIKNVIIERHL